MASSFFADSKAEDPGTVHDFHWNEYQEGNFKKPERISGLAFNVDGSQYVCRDLLGGVALFETSTKRKLRDIEPPMPWIDKPPYHHAELPFSISPEARQIAVAKPEQPLAKFNVPHAKMWRGLVVVRELDTGRVVYERVFPEHYDFDVAMGRRYFMAFGGLVRTERVAKGKFETVRETVRVWDRATGEEKAVFTPRHPMKADPIGRHALPQGPRGYNGFPESRPNSTRNRNENAYVSMNANAWRVIRMFRGGYEPREGVPPRLVSAIECWDAASQR